MDTITVVNMIPKSLSGETNCDSEPSLAVNPANLLQMAGTAFTPNPAGGSLFDPDPDVTTSPVYVSEDGGSTWTLEEIIPGNPVWDQTVRFATSGGNLYGGVLYDNQQTGQGVINFNITYEILRTGNLTGVSPPQMTVLSSRVSVDQPFIEAITVPSGANKGNDAIYVGENDYSVAGGTNGTTTNGTTGTVLQDSNATWTPGALVGMVLVYTSGPCDGLLGQLITANTATTITTGAFLLSPTPSGGDSFTVLKGPYPKGSIDSSLHAQAASPAITTSRLDPRTGYVRDNPQTRPCVNSDGTVYAAYYARGGSISNSYGVNVYQSSVVVVRDDNWGSGSYGALTDPSDNLAGRLVVNGITIPFFDNMGMQRLGGDLSIAVNPTNSSIVYLVYADETTAGDATTYTLHVVKSTNRGVDWSNADLRTIVGATNPSLAIDTNGRVGFLYQQLTGTSSNQRWQTKIELTTNDWAGSTTYTLADTPVDAATYGNFEPYLGDYLYLMTVGTTFYGTFCAENVPNLSNFPSGVTFQRNADWTNNVLKDLNGNTVSASIDPYFFSVAPLVKEVKEVKWEMKEFKETKEVLKDAWFEGTKWEFKEVIYEKILSYELKSWDIKTEDVYNPVDFGYGGGDYGYLGDPEMLRLIAGRIDKIEESLATLRSFITEEDRPQLGEEALKRAREKKAIEDKEKEGRRQQ